MELNKVPPHNLEAEQAVLGAIMLESDMGSPVFAILQLKIFYRDNHRYLFAAIRDLFEKGETGRPCICCRILAPARRLELIGGIATISEIARSVPSAAKCGILCQDWSRKSL